MADFDLTKLDELIHGRLRLGLMAYLASVDSASFAELRDRTEASDGNLSVHLRKLEEGGYVKIEKSFVDRKPHTRAALTKSGRKAWLAYLDQLKALVEEQHT